MSGGLEGSGGDGVERRVCAVEVMATVNAPHAQVKRRTETSRRAAPLYAVIRERVVILAEANAVGETWHSHVTLSKASFDPAVISSPVPNVLFRSNCV